MEQKKDTTVKSKLGVEYTVTQNKAKELVDKFGCEWVGGKPLIKDDSNPTAKDIADKISNITSIEDLEEHKDDNRQVVKTAYSKKLKELKAK